MSEDDLAIRIETRGISPVLLPLQKEAALELALSLSDEELENLFIGPTAKEQFQTDRGRLRLAAAAAIGNRIRAAPQAFLTGWAQDCAWVIRTSEVIAIQVLEAGLLEKPLTAYAGGKVGFQIRQATTTAP